MKIKNPIFKIGRSFLPAILLIFSQTSFALDLSTPGAATTAVQGAKPTATPQSEIEQSTGDPLEDCTRTKDKGIKECQKPSSSGFGAAAGILAGVGGAMAGFSASDMSATDDPEEKAAQQRKTQQMCMLSALLSQLAGALNGSQGDTCGNAANACEKKCNEAMKHYRQEAEKAKAAKDTIAYQDATRKEDKAKEAGSECIKKAQEVAQAAQNQQQQNQQPQSGMDQCQQALDSGAEPDEEVDCSIDKFKTHAACTALTKTDPDGLQPFERTDLVPTITNDSDKDLPLNENAVDFGKTAGNNGGGGNSPGGFGMMGGGNSGNGDGALGKTDGSGKRGGSASMLGSGGSSSGGAGWGNMKGDDEDKKGLGKGLGDSKLLTKRKLAGHKLGQGEFAASTDDIWVRVYTRTSTNCTKQLFSCAPNKSLNPYGEVKSKAK